MDNSEVQHAAALPVTSGQRLAFIDALRGVAVLLMIAQHFSLWVCARTHGSLFVLLTGALGGLSAPIFITLSGVGATLFSEHRNQPDFLLAARGVIILIFGYVMNLLTPHWFSPGSWYVLHIIGAALIMATILRRIPDAGLIVLIFVVLVGTGMLQNHLDTPFRMFNKHMAVPVGLKGGIRYALVEGYFPIFPWIAFFIAGLLSGRWLKHNRLDKIWRMTVMFLVIMALLTIIYFIGPDFTRAEPLERFFRVQLSFYSALTPLSLFLMALSLLFFIVFFRFDQKYGFCQSHVLVCLGRVSLTFFIAHVIVLREGAFYFKYWKILSEAGTIFATLSMLTFFTLVAKMWQKYSYKYGFEWLLRRVSGRLPRLIQNNDAEVYR